MLSPAQQHLRRMQAQLDAQERTGQEPMNGSAYAQQMSVFHHDYLRLKQIQSIEAKAALKQQLIPQYIPYLEGVLKADSGAADAIVTNIFSWSIDAGLYDTAFWLGEYVLRHHLAMPDRFERTAACFLAEEIAEAAERCRRAGTLFASIDILLRTEDLTQAHDMPDQVRAKLHMVIARQGLVHAGDSPTPQVLSQAIGRFHRALALDAKCGCKKELESAERQLRQMSQVMEAPPKPDDEQRTTPNTPLHEGNPSVPATRRPRSGG